VIHLNEVFIPRIWDSLRIVARIQWLNASSEMQKKTFESRLQAVIRRFVDNLSCPLKFELQCFFCLMALMFVQSTPAASPNAADIQRPAVGDNVLRVLSPTLLELLRVNSKQPDPATVDSWNWVNNQQQFVTPDMSSVLGRSISTKA
jgi:hypothetical protein